MSDPKDPYAAIAEPSQSDPYAAIAENQAAASSTPPAAPKKPSLTERVQSGFDRLTAQEPLGTKHTGNKYIDAAITEASNFGSGVLSLPAPLIHPVQTAKTLAHTVAAGLGPSVDPQSMQYQMAQSLYEHPAETVAQLAGQATGGELSGEVMRPVVNAVADRLPAPRASRPVRQLVKDTQAENAIDATKTADANREAAEKQLGAEAKVRKEYIADKAKADAARQSAQEKYDTATAAQAKIAPTEKKLHTEWGNLRAGIETAREKALKIGNEKYNAVHESLNEVPADLEKFTDALGKAESAFGETQSVPPLIKRLNAVKEPITYADEQKIYSELGRELSKGTLQGTTFHAYDELQEAIGQDMQRIADSQGLGKELTDARNYWRRMKQTFGKPLAMRDAATGTLKGSASGLAQEDALQNQIRLLGSFDPDIPKQFAHVQNIEKGVDALPKPVSARELTQKLVESRPSLPARPPELPAPPPEQIPAPKKIGPEEVKAAKSEALAKRAERLRSSHSPIVSSIAAYDAIRSAIEGNWKRVGLDLAARGIYGAGKTGIAIALDNPKVVEFLSRATPRDVAGIPPDIRGEFPNLVRAAQDKGITLSPALKVIAVSGPALAPRKNPSDEWSQQPLQ